MNTLHHNPAIKGQHGIQQQSQATHSGRRRADLMPRAKGTYVTLDSWVFLLSPSLPGVAGIILERLSAQSNYRQDTLTVGQLCHALPFKERAVQNAVAYLVANGYAVMSANAYALGSCAASNALDESMPIRAASARHALDTRTDMHPAQGLNALPEQENAKLNSAIEWHNKKEEKEEKEENKRIKNNAQENTALITAALITSPHSLESVPEKTIRAETETLTTDLNIVPARPAADLPAAPLPVLAGSPQQEMFAALALACYGSHSDLTKAASGRLGRAAKNLLAAKFTADHIAPLVAWMGSTRDENWRSITPSTLEERAPAWRSALSGALPARPEIIKFSARPQTTQDADNRAAQRATDIYQMLQEDQNAVF